MGRQSECTDQGETQLCMHFTGIKMLHQVIAKMYNNNYCQQLGRREEAAQVAEVVFE